jgi:hypothetical protein
MTCDILLRILLLGSPKLQALNELRWVENALSALL